MKKFLLLLSIFLGCTRAVLGQSQTGQVFGQVTDSTGAHAFALINKATGQALKHAPGDLEQCLLTEYDPESRDESVLWTQSEDMGEGYHCVRMANKITSNLDVLRGDKKSGGVKEGSPVILFAWKKQDNQIWKIIPA